MVLAPSDCEIVAALEASFHAAKTYETIDEGKDILVNSNKIGVPDDAKRLWMQIAADLIAIRAPVGQYYLPTSSIIP
jgi:hypothetical protein